MTSKGQGQTAGTRASSAAGQGTAVRDRGVPQPNVRGAALCPAHFLVLSERSALAWVLGVQRMAFPAHRVAEARRLPLRHRLFLYTTRGCFHNPTRDRGRIIGTATIESPVSDLQDPMQLAGRVFTAGCRLAIPKLIPRSEGLDLAPLVPHLVSFPNKHAWSARMRQTLVPIAAEDVPFIDQLLSPLLIPRRRALISYLSAVPRAPASGKT